MTRYAVVTGATNGIGKAIAEGLARQGLAVHVAGRDAGKTQAVVDSIIASTGNAQVWPLLADLDSLAGAQHLADQLLARDQPLHLLVNNAAVMTLQREETVDGVERMLGVNYLAHYLLTRRLLPLLKREPGGRVVNTASDAHRFVKGMHWEDLQWQQGFSAMKVYGHSKLANILFARELARREPELLVLSAHPGAVSTGLGTQNGWLGRWLPRLLKPFFRTPEQGAATSLMLCTGDFPLSASGGYYANAKPKAVAAWAEDDDDARRLWQWSAKVCGLPD